MTISIEEYAQYFKVVGNPTRLAIVLLLYASEIIRGRNSLRYNEIIEALEIPKDKTGNLTSYLKPLIDINFIQKENGEKRNPLYHIGDKGKEFLVELGLTEKLNEIISEYADKTPE